MYLSLHLFGVSFGTPNKGKGKIVSLLGLEDDGVTVLPLGKRDRDEGAEHSAKKGKQTEEVITYQRKKTRKPRKKYKTYDYSMEKNQGEYDLMEDLSRRKPNITFAPMIGLCPRLKKEWQRAVNPKKKMGNTTGNVLSICELPNICPSVEAWHNGLELGEAYIDGGAQIYVITQSCTEKLNLKVSKMSRDGS